jgi:hypothetical protein
MELILAFGFHVHGSIDKRASWSRTVPKLGCVNTMFLLSSNSDDGEKLTNIFSHRCSHQETSFGMLAIAVEMNICIVEGEMFRSFVLVRSGVAQLLLRSYSTLYKCSRLLAN